MSSDMGSVPGQNVKVVLHCYLIWQSNFHMKIHIWCCTLCC